MSHEFSIVIEKDSDGYFVASVPALPGCHTQAKSMDQLLERTREAILLCLEEYSGEEQTILSAPQFLGIQRISIDQWPEHRA